MNVRELIAELEKHDGDKPVYACHYREAVGDTLDFDVTHLLASPDGAIRIGQNAISNQQLAKLG